MLRREFSSGLVAAAAGLTLTPALAQRVAPQEGKDFTRLAKPAPTQSAPGQVEVVEFFSYSCIHCYNFEPLFEAWLQKQPAQVTVRRMPVAFNPNFAPMQRLYFALESMGLIDKLHLKVFKAMHEERLPLTTAPVILDWIEKQGVNREQFTALFNGTAARLTARATALQEAYQVEGTPALGIAGRFYVSGQGPRTLVIADALIAEARKG